ncbi:ATP-grasp domain-containing protein [Streptomyces sp. TRM68367]|uniref:ATP-grasp domain-containing protein n=1 Tax=Streptomyces sp. TRM68367 TaxID=2758415 RepID=UPI00165BE4D4|nr:ATP-grasp domain-containing protein [Streptomyces sp. TRM68367]MBC9726540.1 ATP-grasp domain-containing protein [Streptomyces sp. TRM68367]
MSNRVLVVQPAFSGNAYVAHARSLGWDVLVASHEGGSRQVAEPVRSLATELITVDTNDSAALAAAVDEAHQRSKIDAVVAGGEFYVPAAARLADQLGVLGLDPAAVDRVRRKPDMRHAVADAGLEVPRFTVVRDLAGLDEACAYVGFPAVIKPVESGGSIHVSRVDSLEEARAALEAIYADEELEFDRPLDTDAIVEQYVSGPEYSADGCVHDGEVVVVAVTRKLLGPEPRFLEIGHLTPAPLDEATRQEITKYAEGVVKAVGITTGPFHCELRLGIDGRPVLMEIAARLPGDKITELMEMSTGLVLPRMVLASATGSDPVSAGAYREPDAPAAGIRFLTASGSGAYTRLEGWDELTAEPWVVGSQILIEPGAAVRTDEADYRCRIAVVVFTAGSPAEAQERWTEIGDRVRVLGD